ncbi:hypothetical protein CspeluHIS016_0208310 [Cutaneotrichosporon spelunceum]|uniref:Alpha/beta-hydrolase n=1 Tax=Cutaneotrichosporon spelunceum TaxID=1672016 RepID=A0AAD3YA90_9TREE|nr:hypothetical protein CspeluHIS016_0208310 [Cutaneotrichosporon spelunceum]
MVRAWQTVRVVRPLYLRPSAALRHSSTSTQTSCTRWLVRPPSPAAPRECPTPLVLLRTPGLGYGASPESSEPWKVWADMFALRGYTTVEVDVGVSVPLVAESEQAGIKQAADTLDAQLRRLLVPFAPVIIASGPACLVAQAYVSDYRAGGLVVLEPPPDEDPRAEAKPFAWPAFRFEPRFPILVMPPPGGEEGVRTSRLGMQALDEPGGRGVSVIVEKDGPRGEETRMDVERWLDWSGY